MKSTIRIVNKILYSLFGAACLAFGAAVLLIDTSLMPANVRSRLVEEVQGNLNMLHLMQEFGTILIMVGLLAFWFVRHYERSRFFHWALTTHFALLALVHWFDVRGPFPSAAGPLVTTIPFLLFLAVGALRGLTEEDRVSDQ